MGKILAAFPLGYLLTQLAGGVASQHLGAKNVLTFSLVSVGVLMAAAPGAASFQGATGLSWLYFFMGLIAGPTYPAFSVVAARNFSQQELSRVSSYTSVSTSAGQLVATGIVPVLALYIGWRQSFVALGACMLVFAALWAFIAPDQRKAALAAASSSSIKTETLIFPPSSFWLSPSVWVVVLMHMAFNGSKYMLTAWISTYFFFTFELDSAESAGYIGLANALQLVGPVMWKRMDHFLRNRWQSQGVPEREQLLWSRKLFASVAFGGVAATSLLFALQHHYHYVARNNSQGSVIIVTLLLCLTAIFNKAHALSYKPNYLDLTQKYQGVLVGGGNTLACY